ncbi:MAG: lamin tail domain-containing protein, partial [Nanoarchaeota archaeon]
MADPIADETLNEWIELYNDEGKEINVSGWIIGDDNDNDTIEGGLYNKEGAIIGAFGYAILTDDATRVYDNFNTSNDAIRLYVDDSSIGGNGLSNDGETFYLYDDASNLIDAKSYNKTAEGLSWAHINGTLMKSSPSPGFSNNGSILSEQSCDYAVDFILAKSIFDNSSDFSFQAIVSNIKGRKTNFTSGGKIEDFNGKIMQEYRFFTEEEITTKRTSSKYSPNLEEGKSYILSSNLTVWCNDSNSENNFDIEIITIKGKPLENNSFLKIAQVYDLGNDEEAKFGDTIRIKISAYKGNTNKESISVWIEDEKNKISKESRTSLFFKYTNYSITIPIQIKPNCDEKFDNGEYSIIAEGLGIKGEKEIDVSGLASAMCDKKEDKKDNKSLKKFDFKLIDFKEEIEIGREFKTDVLMNNNGDEKIPIKLWSYVYRGS